MVYFLKMRQEVFHSIYWVAYNTDLLWPFGVQHVYFCIDNVVIFNRFITDIPGTCIFIMGNPEFIYMIEKNNEIMMDYSRLDMINSEICNGILNCNTRSYVIPVY